MFNFLSLAYFTSHSILQFCLRCCEWQDFILCYGWIVFYYVDKLHFPYPFILILNCHYILFNLAGPDEGWTLSFHAFPSLFLFFDLSLPLTTILCDSVLSGCLSLCTCCCSASTFSSFFCTLKAEILQGIFLVRIYFLFTLLGSAILFILIASTLTLFNQFLNLYS